MLLNFHFRQAMPAVLLSSLLLLGACSPAATPSLPAPISTIMLPASPEPSLTLLSSPTQPRPTHALAHTATPPVNICSPLAQVPIEDLSQAISNPYHPPPLGSDDPHEGIDLAVLSPGTGIALTGAAVQAVLPGTVAAVLADRFPYGNALIIETPLDGLPPAWISTARLPQPIPTLPPHRSLTCPNAGFTTSWPAEPRSLYLVYAHMLETPTFQIGDAVSCGDALGAVGASGNALNPHLHLEARVGPAGARFASLAHYDTRATPLEMQAYCVWRVSGWFQLLDPLSLFSMQN